MPVIAKIGTDVAIAVASTIVTTAILKMGETIWKIRRKPKITVL